LAAGSLGFPAATAGGTSSARAKRWRSGPALLHGRAAVTLVRELGRLATATEGTRNRELNRTAYVLGRYVAAGELGANELGVKLTAIAVGLGLSQAEAERTVASGFLAAVKEHV
jgi:hypothetical protein